MERLRFSVDITWVVAMGCILVVVVGPIQVKYTSLVDKTAADLLIFRN